MGTEQRVALDCPTCGRRHRFAAPVHPCACGAPVAAPLEAGAPPQPVTGRSWADEWVLVRCSACGLDGHWPQPELGCPCGTLLRIPVLRTDGRAELPAGPSSGGRTSGDAVGAARTPAAAPTRRPAAAPRPAFRPPMIRTTRDAVTAAALYLRWLGFHDIIAAENRPDSGIDLRGPDVLAHVEPTALPVAARSVECLWLYGLSECAQCVVFSLAGYTPDALAGADRLDVPLFAMDLTGAPRPINSSAVELISAGS